MSEVFDIEYLEFLALQTGFKIPASKLTPLMFSRCNSFQGSGQWGNQFGRSLHHLEAAVEYRYKEAELIRTI